MNGYSASYVPGGFEQEAQAPMAQVQGNSDILDFLRQVSRRQHLGKMASPRRGPRAMASGGSRPPVQSAGGDSDGHDSFTRQMQQLQLRKAQGEVNDADSIRNMRKVPVQMGNGIYGVAYDWDARSANPIQQQAISPQNAQFEGAGAFNPTATPQGADADWANFLRDVQLRQAMASNGGL